MIGPQVRPATAQDADFVYHLVKTTMATYVNQTWDLTESQKEKAFRDEFDLANDQIIVFQGEDVGVISTERSEDEVFIDKIYILPEYQRRGIGTRLIQGVLDEAFDSGLPVTLHVLKVNPAKRLYERLGFVRVEETDASYVLKAAPQRAEADPMDVPSHSDEA